MQASGQFQLLGGNPAVDLVNTLDDRFAESGPRELLADYADLLQFSEQSGLLSNREADTLERQASERKRRQALEEARALRETLASIFYELVEERDPKSLAELDAAVKAAESQRELCWQNSATVWSWERAKKDARYPVWRLAVEAADLLTSHGLQHLRACSAQRCRWLFLDTSKNRTRRWCDMKTCGNREKVKRFQQRA